MRGEKAELPQNVTVVYVPAIPKIGVSAMNNITARANVLYSITWTSQDDVPGWHGRHEPHIFEKGRQYRLPYGRPLSRGKFIFSGVTTEKTVSVEDFLDAAADIDSVFYKQRSGKLEDGRLVKTSVFYALDCSAFVSFCWALPEIRKTYNIKRDDVSFLGKCTGESIALIEPGDALNLARKEIAGLGHHPHIVLVTGVGDGLFEITEQTPPQLTRRVFTKAELEKKYGGHSIFRYKFRDSVPAFFE